MDTGIPALGELVWVRMLPIKQEGLDRSYSVWVCLLPPDLSYICLVLIDPSDHNGAEIFGADEAQIPDSWQHEACTLFSNVTYILKLVTKLSFEYN